VKKIMFLNRVNGKSYKKYEKPCKIKEAIAPHETARYNLYGL